MVIKLTNEQREAIKRATGKDISELRVDALGGLTPSEFAEFRKAPAELDRKAPAEFDRKAPAELDRKAPAELDRKAPAELDRKAPAELDRKAPIEFE